jgi:hypothetical protein
MQPQLTQPPVSFALYASLPESHQAILYTSLLLEEMPISNGFLSTNKGAFWFHRKNWGRNSPLAGSYIRAGRRLTKVPIPLLSRLDQLVMDTPNHLCTVTTTKTTGIARQAAFVEQCTADATISMATRIARRRDPHRPKLQQSQV